MAYCGDETKARHVKTAVQGDEIWCQLFSEPAGGSMSRRAHQSGQRTAIPGRSTLNRKSGRPRAIFRLRLLLTPHRPERAQAQGPTSSICRWKTTGLDVRPIKQAIGASGFNEIFFTYVKIPIRNASAKWAGLAGRAHHADAWRLASGGQGGGIDVPQLMQLARTLELEDDLRSRMRRAMRRSRTGMCAPPV